MTGRNRDLRFDMVKSLTIRHIRPEHGGRIYGRARLIEVFLQLH